MSKVSVSFRIDAGLYRRFRKVAIERGHTVTWYLEGCMREVLRDRKRGASVVKLVKRPVQVKRHK